MLSADGEILSFIFLFFFIRVFAELDARYYVRHDIIIIITERRIRPNERTITKRVCPCCISDLSGRTCFDMTSDEIAVRSIILRWWLYACYESLLNTSTKEVFGWKEKRGKLKISSKFKCAEWRGEIRQLYEVWSKSSGAFEFARERRVAETPWRSQLLTLFYLSHVIFCLSL